MADERPPLPDFYAVLGIGFDATNDELRQAWRTAVKQWHPDTNRSPEAHGMMTRINEAWEVLGDPERRAEYDTLYFTLRAAIANEERKLREEERLERRRQERIRQQERERQRRAEEAARKRAEEEEQRRKEQARKERERREAEARRKAEREKREKERKEREQRERERREAEARRKADLERKRREQERINKEREEQERAERLRRQREAEGDNGLERNREPGMPSGPPGGTANGRGRGGSGGGRAAWGLAIVGLAALIAVVGVFVANRIEEQNASDRAAARVVPTARLYHTPTPRPTPVPTATPSPTAVPTPSPTATPAPTPMPTVTPIPAIIYVTATPTRTPVPRIIPITATPTRVPRIVYVTATPKPTPRITFVTATPRPTPLPTPVPIPTATSTPTAIPTPSSTPAPSITSTPTREPSATQTPTKTPTPVPTSTATPTAVPNEVATRALWSALVRRGLPPTLDEVALFVRLGANLSATNSLGETMYEYALSRGFAHSIVRLLSAGLSKSAATDALWSVVYRSGPHPARDEVVNLIGLGADVSVPDSTGRTMLQYVVDGGYDNALWQLFSAGLSESAATSALWSLLRRPIPRPARDEVAYLIELGADIRSLDFEMLRYAVSRGYDRDVVELLAGSVPTLEPQPTPQPTLRGSGTLRRGIIDEFLNCPGPNGGAAFIASDATYGGVEFSFEVPRTYSWSIGLVYHVGDAGNDTLTYVRGVTDIWGFIDAEVGVGHSTSVDYRGVGWAVLDISPEIFDARIGALNKLAFTTDRGGTALELNGNLLLRVPAPKLMPRASQMQVCVGFNSDEDKYEIRYFDLRAWAE